MIFSAALLVSATTFGMNLKVNYDNLHGSINKDKFYISIEHMVETNTDSKYVDLFYRYITKKQQTNFKASIYDIPINFFTTQNDTQLKKELTITLGGDICLYKHCKQRIKYMNQFGLPTLFVGLILKKSPNTVCLYDGVLQRYYDSMEDVQNKLFVPDTEKNVYKVKCAMYYLAFLKNNNKKSIKREKNITLKYIGQISPTTTINLELINIFAKALDQNYPDHEIIHKLEAKKIKGNQKFIPEKNFLKYLASKEIRCCSKYQLNARKRLVEFYLAKLTCSTDSKKKLIYKTKIIDYCDNILNLSFPECANDEKNKYKQIKKQLEEKDRKKIMTFIANMES